MQHYKNRLATRLIEQAGLSIDNASRLVKDLSGIARATDCDCGVFCGEIDFQGQAWTNSSNGEQIWAIIRNNRIITIMFRRKSQPQDAVSMRVDRILKINENKY
ncbi:MAG: hypothetical protein HOG49_01065 [Candidatus Scalindua sp.]|nr:hypothetical protein [Candidatus Scalindua sp.]